MLHCAVPMGWEGPFSSQLAYSLSLIQPAIYLEKGKLDACPTLFTKKKENKTIQIG